jgi:hypothetical protein
MFTQSVISFVPAVSSEFDHFRQHHKVFVVLGTPPSPLAQPVGQALNF